MAVCIAIGLMLKSLTSGGTDITDPQLEGSFSNNDFSLEFF